ncbi:mitochondrial PGP phosphatase-domain-containing protein [Rhodocollybia butyracea]|uniref:Mitochondrial PGP phosphatase-domain-containing protein n=1 Tax=Rhodocollybia butyracea TaxID=206335 RepID=A0A9P5Q572_9AGAR|nr:mitochondrial PGP phosphatase-domain-containing protein [Rhodocollybia butyracea]
MPLNVPGILVPLQLLVKPRIIVPALCVKDIRHLDFHALKRAGYRGAIFDKDNCLTLPGKDTLVPEIEAAWKECRQVFGADHILVVSNSAGTSLDAGGIQGESVRHHLGVPVLFHTSMKPAYSCVKQIQSFFRSIHVKDHELIVVGDRLFTDIVLAARIREESWKERFGSRPVASLSMNTTQTSDISLPLQNTLGIWTTGVWVKEATFMRFCERKVLEAVKKWVITPAKARANGKEKASIPGSEVDTEQSPQRALMEDSKSSEADEEEAFKRAFVRQIPSPPPPQKKSILRNIIGFVQNVQFRRGT